LSRHLTLALGLLAAGSVGAATAYPFPYMADYPSGTRASTLSATTIQSKYTTWKANYYTENGDKARIEWADPSAPAQGCSSDAGDCTVSEGIGYGMLIAVYMDNATNSTQPMFDKGGAGYDQLLDNIHHELIVFAHNLYTLEPLAGAKITVYSNKSQVISAADTDAAGTVHFTGLEARLGKPTVVVAETVWPGRLG